MDGGAWWAPVHGVVKSVTRLSDFTFTFHSHALEKEMSTHSSVLAWRIPGTGEPGGLPSMGSHRVGHDWCDLAAAAASQYTCCGSWVLVLLQEGGPLPGPGSGLLSKTRKWIVQGDTCADNAKDFIGKGSQADSSRVRGPRRTAETALVAVSGFMVIGLVSELSLANHSDSEPFLVMHALLHQDGS